LKKKICIIDYGMGNLKSVEKAFEYIGYSPVISSDKDEIKKYDAIVLPGVGAFGKAMQNIERLGLAEVIWQKALNALFLGICLGYQLLYDFSEEGNCNGLGILKGRVKRFAKIGDIKIPHMGWNKIEVDNKSILLKGIDGGYVYFVHSYYVDNDKKDIVSSRCEHGIKFDASIEHKNLFATQFHPEKSGELGLEILKNFGRLL